MSTIKTYTRVPRTIEGGTWEPNTPQGEELMGFFVAREYEVKQIGGYLLIAKLDDIIRVSPGSFAGITDQGELNVKHQDTLATFYKEQSAPKAEPLNSYYTTV